MKQIGVGRAVYSVLVHVMGYRENVRAAHATDWGCVLYRLELGRS